MKTTEEIKRDAETCMNHPYMESCNSCRLYGECRGISDRIVKELYDLVQHYESRLEQTERERDAAVHDLGRNWKCEICKKRRKPITKCPYYTDCGLGYIHWEWRGVCDENTEEKP